jgi:hypothetical protein
VPASAAGTLGTKRPDGPAGYWAESQGKFQSELKIRFFTLPRLSKFVQGDLGGILIWGFFLNSSRILLDFRKNILCHAMQCILCKIIFVMFFIFTAIGYATYMHFYAGKKFIPVKSGC